MARQECAFCVWEQPRPGFLFSLLLNSNSLSNLLLVHLAFRRAHSQFPGSAYPLRSKSVRAVRSKITSHASRGKSQRDANWASRRNLDGSFKRRDGTIHDSKAVPQMYNGRVVAAKPRQSAFDILLYEILGEV
jgi:hypothetical protein